MQTELVGSFGLSLVVITFDAAGRTGVDRTAIIAGPPGNVRAYEYDGNATFTLNVTASFTVRVQLPGFTPYMSNVSNMLPASQCVNVYTPQFAQST